MEISPSRPRASFASLQARLLLVLRQRLANGELTERSLARLTGISQPHMHNVLKGVRSVSVDFADTVMARLGLTIYDLLDRPIAIDGPATEPYSRSVPILEGAIGPGHPMPISLHRTDTLLVPVSILAGMSHPVAARLAADPEMESLVRPNDHVLLDRSDRARTNLLLPGYYLAQTPEGPRVRGLVARDDLLYLFTEQIRQWPALWRPLGSLENDHRPVLLGRIIWLSSPRFEPPQPQAFRKTSR